MRVLVDLQASQTESRLRGIGRYSTGFFKGLARTSPSDEELMLWLDGTYPEQASVLRQDLTGYIENDFIRYGYYPWPQEFISDRGDAIRQIAPVMHRFGQSQLSPDVFHLSSLFEGYVEPACVADGTTGLPGTVSSVTLYDLIPAKMPEWYLTDKAYAGWYQRKLKALRRFDVFLCISEATRNDASDILGLPIDRFTVIDSGIDHGFFKPLSLINSEFTKVNATLSKFGIRRDFVLYTGNGDPRKNVRRAIEAFAALPRRTRDKLQLVLNQVDDKSDISRLTKETGMASDAVIVTGHVSDLELRDLIRSSSVFFFPSLYEGFGLPVLEAMACGTPTICSNQSSLPEVVSNDAAMFNPYSIMDMRDKLQQALEDTEFRKDLVSKGISRAGLYTWERTATLARDRWQEEVRHKRERFWSTPFPTTRRLRVAMVTPLPPEQTGIATYMSSILDALATEFDMDIFTTAPMDQLSGLASIYRIFPVEELEVRFRDYDQVVYQMGNSPFHTHVLRYSSRIPGVIVLHDLYVSSLLAYLQYVEGQTNVFEDELALSHGRGASADLMTDAGWEAARLKWPASARLVQSADAVLMHSQHGLDELQRNYPGIERAQLFQTPLPVVVSPPSLKQRSEAREALQIRNDEILVISAGFIADTKMALEILEAISGVKAPPKKKIVLSFVGANDGGDYGQRVTDMASSLQGRVGVRITGFVSAVEYEQYLNAADVAIQLRCSSRGESSLTVLECMAHGIPVIANKYGSSAELPAGTYKQLSSNPTVTSIRKAIEELMAEPSVCSGLSDSALNYIENACSPENVARVYRQVVERSLLSRNERTGSGLERTILHSFKEYQTDANTEFALENALVKLFEARPARIFVDVSDYSQQDYRTGIHRVVRNVLREMVLDEKFNAPVTPFAVNAMTGEALEVQLAADELVGRTSLRIQNEVRLQPGDTIYLLDSTWSSPQRFDNLIGQARDVGATVAVMVYDLIPLRHPQFCVDYMPGIFAQWLRYVVEHASVLTCISQSVVDDLKMWIAEQGSAISPFRGQQIVATPLGADLDCQVYPDVEVRPELSAFVREGRVGAMIGTLEPRKRQDLVLDAYRTIWRDDLSELHKLLILGKQGWNVENLVEELLAEDRTRVLWVPDASDAEIQWVYRNADRVIQASDAEGYGLPIIEAIHEGASVLASDLPVFREIAGNGITYFNPGCVTSLIQKILAPAEPSQPLKNRTWSETARLIVEQIS